MLKRSPKYIKPVKRNLKVLPLFSYKKKALVERISKVALKITQLKLKIK
jgi:hypothetical protein